MFGRKRKEIERVTGTATVASATFVGAGDDGSAVFDFVLDVALEGAAPFRQTVRQEALADQHPRIGDVVAVQVDPRDRSVRLGLDDDPRFRAQTNDEANAFNHRCAANLDEITHLERTGRTMTAVVREATECGWMRALGQREFAVVATVTPPDGEPYDARFAIFDTTQGLYTPTVGQTIAVVVAPDEPAMVRASTFWDKPSLALDNPTFPGLTFRWHVPEECPNCGARVDQSTESMADHPACRMCRAPLPCRPA